MPLARAYYEANKAAIMSRIREWQISNPDKRRATKKKYYENNKSKVVAAFRRWKKANPERYLFGLAKRHAKRYGRELDIEVADIVIPDVCPHLGIPISIESHDIDFRPSLDRKDNSRGYVRGNVMVISHRANRLKNNANGDELLALAISVLRMEGKIE